MHAPKHIHAIADFRLATESIDTNLGTMFGKHSPRIPAFREDGDRAHGQIFGGVRDGLAYGFGNRITVVLTTAAAWRRQVRDTGLRLQNDARHHGHGLPRITPAGSLSRKHHHAGPVKNRFPPPLTPAPR